MEPMKILIVGGGRSPTGRSLWLRDRLIGLGADVEYRSIDAKIQGEKIHTALIDMDFSELELRFANAMTYGHSHPEMLKCWDDVEKPSPDKLKGPKGPRNRWGKIQ